jgi:hypothetical protein
MKTPISKFDSMNPDRVGPGGGDRPNRPDLKVKVPGLPDSGNSFGDESISPIQIDLLKSGMHFEGNYLSESP